MPEATAEATEEKNGAEIAGEIGEEERVDRAEKPTSAHLREEDLPAPLQDRADDLDHALNETPPPMDLDEGTRYEKAIDAKRIAAVLIEELHEELEGLVFEVWFRSSLRHGGSAANAKTSTPPGRWKKVTGIDFYLDVSLPRWVEMSAAERIRLVDHELAHVEASADGASIGKHEIEEFSSILRRWGPTSSQEDFVEAASQIELGL